MIKNALNFIIFSNILVALCAGLLVTVSRMLLPFSGAWYLDIFVFLSTLAVYNFQRIFPIVFGEIEEGLNERQQWVMNRLSGLIIFSTFALFFSSLIFLFIIKEKLLMLAILFPFLLISFWYAIDLKQLFRKSKKRYRRLRVVPYLKIFLIVLTWMIVTLALPVAEQDINPLSKEVVLLFFERLFFIFAITLPFDIRDMEQDENLNVLTIPNSIGVRRTVALSVVALIFSGILSISRIWLIPETAYAVVPLLLSVIITIFIISKARPEKPELYFSGLVESTMLMQFLLVGISFWLVNLVKID